MIGWFRKNQKVIFYSTMPILALILGLPTVIMAVLGGSQELAYYTVAGEKFDVHRVRGEMIHLRGAYNQLLLSLTNFGLRDQMPTERDAIDRYVLLQQAESAGIEVPIIEVGDRAKDFYSDLIASRQVFTRIRSLPASGRDSAWARLFPAEKSRVKFDRQDYETWLGGKTGLSNFESFLREEIQLEKLNDLVRRAGRADPEEIYERYQRENQKKKIAVVALKGKQFLRQVDFVLEESPEDYYERSRETLLDPARVAVEYVFLPYQDVEVDDPTDEEVQAYYEANAEDFMDAETGETRPLEDVSEEIQGQVREESREKKASVVLEQIREQLSSEEGELSAVAKEKAGLEAKTTELLALDAFRDLPEIGLETVFDDALQEGKGALGDVGAVIESGAYLYRVADAQPERELAFSEVREQMESDVEELHQEDLLHYFERNRERYSQPTRYRIEYARGPAGDDAGATRSALTEIRNELEKKRRAKEEFVMKDEVTGDLEYLETGEPISLEDLARKEEFEPDDFIQLMDGLRGDISFPWQQDKYVYLFRVAEKIEDEVEFEEVRAQVEKDAAADTERAVRGAYERWGDRFRRTARVNVEILLADASKVPAEVQSDDDIENYYEEHQETFARPPGEEDPETGSVYYSVEEMKEQIAQALTAEAAEKRCQTVLEGLASKGAKTPLADLLAAAKSGDRLLLELITRQSLGPDEVRDSEEFGSGTLALQLDSLVVGKVTGPIDADRGWLLVRATGITEARVPPLELIRSDVENALVSHRQRYVEEKNLFQGSYRKQEKYEVEYLIARYKDYLSKTEEPTDEEIQDQYDIRRNEFKLDPEESRPEEEDSKEEEPGKPQEDRYRPLEEVRDEIVLAIRMEDATQLATDDIKAVKKEMDKDKKDGNPQDFELYRVISDGLALEKPEPLDFSGVSSHDDIQAPKLRTFLRGAKDADLTDVIENQHSEAKFILRMKKKTRGGSSDLVDVISDVKKDYSNEEALDVAMRRLEQVREEVEEQGRSLKEVAEERGYTVIESDFINRTNRYLKGIPSPFSVIYQSFKISEGLRLTNVMTDRIRYRAMLAEALEKEDADSAEFALKQAQLSKSMGATAQDEFQRRWQSELLLRARGLGDEALSATYEKHFRNKVRVRQIVVRLNAPFVGERVLNQTRRDDEYVYPMVRVAMKEALQNAENAYARLRNSEPFAELAQKLSYDDSSAQDGGWTPPRSRDVLAAAWGDEVARGIVATQVGSYTRPLKGDDGYHLFLVEDRKGDVFHLRHIQFQATPSFLPTDLEREAKDLARGEAEELRSRLEKGKSFADLAIGIWDYQRTPANAAGDLGEIGYADRISYPEELIDAMLAAESGKLSEVIETDIGYHVFRVYARNDVPFEDVWLDVALQTLEANNYPYTDPNKTDENQDQSQDR